MPLADFPQNSNRHALETDIETHEPGHSLARAFYTSPSIYEKDLDRVWGQNWIWAGHASQVPESGDYFLFEIGPESVIVVRGRTGAIHAHMNVCRHRGSRVCLEHSGNTGSFTCPYHAWTYNLDGTLFSARLMDAGIDRAGLGLKPVPPVVRRRSVP